MDSSRSYQAATQASRGAPAGSADAVSTRAFLPPEQRGRQTCSSSVFRPCGVITRWSDRAIPGVSPSKGITRSPLRKAGLGERAASPRELAAVPAVEVRDRDPVLRGVD